MIERRGLFRDGFKAKFADLKIERPPMDECDCEPIVLTDELLAEWEAQATEIVDCEPINDAEWRGGRLYGSEELPLTIIRCVHPDGKVTIEPVHKLFPINKRNHFIMRNTLLGFVDVEWDLKRSIEWYQSSLNAPAREWCPELPVTRRNLWYERQLQMMYCRKYDINMYQAKMRTSGRTPEKWIEEFDGKFDEDLCFVWWP